MNYDELKKRYGQGANVRRKRRHIESDIQIGCISWFRSVYPKYTIFAVPNGGSRNAKEAAIMRAEGIMAGVADLIAVADGKVLFIEMKAPKGRQTPLQKAFEERIEGHGFPYRVCRSVREFSTVVAKWLKDEL